MKIRDQRVQLFSAFETKDGTVQFNMPKNLNYEHPTAGELKIKESHISCHPSPNMDANTLKYTHTFEDGTKRSSKARHLSEKNKSCIPAFFCKANRLELATLKTHKARDEIIDLGSYNPEVSTLIFAVFITPPSVRPPKFGKNINFVAKSFSQWTASLCWIFSELTASERLIVTPPQTIPARDNRITNVGRSIAPIAGFGENEARKIFMSMCQRYVLINWRDLEEMQSSRSMPHVPDFLKAEMQKRAMTFRKYSDPDSDNFFRTRGLM
ncbi:MAG: hypothetical protein AAGI14_09615 [Pseudomonadota bacterium]